MAAAPKPPPSPPYADLIRAAMTATGAANAGQLADAIGMGGRNDAKRVQNWVAGNNAPDYNGTMLLLDAAGWLNKDAEEARRRATAPGPLEALAAAAVEQGRLLAAIAERVGVDPAALEPSGARRSQPKAPPKRKRAAR